jgi:hypothetical protein
LEFSEDAVLFEQIRDQPRLISVDEACERDEKQLQREIGGHTRRSSALERMT